MAKIGIYGGTFNPPHLGHVLAARAAKASLGLDQVLLIPRWAAAAQRAAGRLAYAGAAAGDDQTCCGDGAVAEGVRH